MNIYLHKKSCFVTGLGELLFPQRSCKKTQNTKRVLRQTQGAPAGGLCEQRAPKTGAPAALFCI